MAKYKFGELTKDENINKLFREIQDNFADVKELNEKETKVTKYTTVKPKNSDLQDGEKIVYFDGTNYYRYYKVQGKLFVGAQLTEVI